MNTPVNPYTMMAELIRLLEEQFRRMELSVISERSDYITTEAAEIETTCPKTKSVATISLAIPKHSRGAQLRLQTLIYAEKITGDLRVYGITKGIRENWTLQGSPRKAATLTRELDKVVDKLVKGVCSYLL